MKHIKSPLNIPSTNLFPSAQQGSHWCIALGTDFCALRNTFLISCISILAGVQEQKLRCSSAVSGPSHKEMWAAWLKCKFSAEWSGIWLLDGLQLFNQGTKELRCQWAPRNHYLKHHLSICLVGYHHCKMECSARGSEWDPRMYKAVALLAHVVPWSELEYLQPSHLHQVPAQEVYYIE